MRLLRAWLRRATFRPCSLCGSRTRCWRWHVELATCPTCARTVDEFDPAFLPIMSAVFDRLPPSRIMITRPTTTGGSTYTLRWKSGQE